MEKLAWRRTEKVLWSTDLESSRFNEEMTTPEGAVSVMRKGSIAGGLLAGVATVAIAAAMSMGAPHRHTLLAPIA